MVVSSIKDDLKLLFSDYKISGSDYDVLSEVLVSNGVSEIAFGGLIQIIKLLYDTGAKFPIAVNLLKRLWEEEYINFNFIKSLAPLIDKDLIVIKRVDFSKLKSSTAILYNIGLEDESSEKCAVIYSTEKLEKIKEEVFNVLSKYKFELTSFIHEGVEVEPQKVKAVVDKTNNLLQSMGIHVSVESYMKDTSYDTEEINLVVTGVSSYIIKDSEIQRIINKSLKSLGYVNTVEAYKEGKSELFIGLNVKTQGNYKGLHTKLFEAIHYLEVNSVQKEET